jgi:fumarate reductase flavoprotein subunit
MTQRDRAARRDGLVVVIGGGLAGLVAACTLFEHGHDVLVCERAEHPGGTTRLSAGWIWRYRDPAAYRELAPNGDPDLQRVIWEELPAALSWLVEQGVVVEERSSNPLTDGARVSPGACIDELTRKLPAGSVRTSTMVMGVQVADRHGSGRFVVELQSRTRTEHVHAAHIVHAGGGFAANLDRIAAAAGIAHTGTAWIRAAEECDGSSIDIAARLGAAREDARGEAYCRLMPAGIDPQAGAWSEDALPLADAGILVDAHGEVVNRATIDWADTLRAWELVRRGGSGWLLVPEHELDRQISHGTIRSTIARAEARGGIVVHQDLESVLGHERSPEAADAVASAAVAVAVNVGITHTMGGLRINRNAQVLGSHGPIPGVWAAGVDVGGISVGGYTSGLAQALVFGRITGRCIDSA